MNVLTKDAAPRDGTLVQGSKPKRGANAKMPSSQQSRKEFSKRMQRYRRNCDNRIRTETIETTKDQQRQRRRRAMMQRSSEYKRSTKTWIDRVDEGHRCPWWDCEAFWDWWASIFSCCGCFWSSRKEEKDDDDDTIPDATAFSPSLCQPFSSQLPTVTVHVEAIAIGPLDNSNADHPESSEEEALGASSNTLSFVGFIPKDPTYSVTLPCKYSVDGTRVASLKKIEPSATHTLAPKHLFTVPRDLDAADMAMVLAYDLPALDKLFFGKPHSHRYSLTSLRNQSILIRSHSGWTPEIRSMVRAAIRAGAVQVYVALSATATPSANANLLRKVTVLPSLDPYTWLSQVEGRMHRVLDYAFPLEAEWMQRAVAPQRGEYIACPLAPPKEDSSSSWMWPGTQRMAHPYVPPDGRKDGSQNIWRQRDLQFLLSLLSTRALRPEVDAFLTLSDVTRPFPENDGALICEPWKVKETIGEELSGE